MSANLNSLRRIPQRGIIAGVCAGLADHFDWSVKLLRVLAVVLFFCSAGVTLLLYAALWYVMDPLSPSEAGALPASGSPPPRGPSMPSMNDVKARFARLDERLRSIEECVTEKEFELRRELKKLEA